MSQLEVRRAVVSDAKRLAALFTDSLGPLGKSCAECDPYPDPDLFSASSIADRIENHEREFWIGSADDEAVSAAVLDSEDPSHIEVNSLVVAPALRRLGVGETFVRRMLESDSFEGKVHTTELVTAHPGSIKIFFACGISNVTGFSLAQYPRVFSAELPESTVWVTSLSRLRIPAGPRTIFLPKDLQPLVRAITDQFAPALEYRFSSGAETSAKGEFQTFPRTGLPYAIVTVTSCSFEMVNVVKEEIRSLLSAGKRHILLRINANDPGATSLCDELLKAGAIPHGFVPLGGRSPNSNELFDMITLQILAPRAALINPMTQIAKDHERTAVLKVLTDAVFAAQEGSPGFRSQL